MAMPDENNNDPTSQDELDRVANHPASDGVDQADQPDRDAEGSAPTDPGTAAEPDAEGSAANEPDGSADQAGEAAPVSQTQEGEKSEAAGGAPASDVSGAPGESDSSAGATDTLSQEHTDAPFAADAAIDASASQPASQQADESTPDETDTSEPADDQNLAHQADARPLDMPDLEATQAAAEANAASIELLQDVELGVTIELGRCRMYVEDVLKLDQGAVVELDKLAGDPVDVYVNERLIARGEVLVLNDNFCVRINEIVAPVQEAKTL